MTKTIIKVGFNFRYAPSGTVYKKSFGVSELVFDCFMDTMACKVAMDEDASGWLNKRPERAANLVFLNLTQADYFVKWASNLHGVEINLKRANVKNNAYLIVNA